jgi:FMN phosphatase YigB (HAD superfamily)
MRVRTALVVSGGGLQGLALIKALRVLPDVRILVADCYQENIARYFADACFRAPLLKDEQAFLDFLVDLCRREGVDFVFPATNFELDLLERNRVVFEVHGVTVFVSSRPLLDLAQDKKRFHDWLVGAGLPSLPGFDTPLDPGVTFPLFGKPRRGFGGRGTVTVENRRDYLALAEEFKQGYLWQPLLPEFDEFSVDFSVDVEGAISPLAIRRRIRTLGGFAILCEPSGHAQVSAVASATIRGLASLGARGVMNLQLLVTREGCWVSDLNPRVGTSMPLSLANGENPIAFLLGLGTAREPAPPRHPCYRTLRTLEERCIPRLGLDRVRAVVFDLDDTLFDQKDWILRKLTMTWDVERALLPERTRFLALALRIIEEGNRSKLFDALCRELELGELERSRLIDTYRAAQPDNCVLYQDAKPCLTQLRRLGYGLGLITDNPPASQRAKLERAELAGYFDAILLTGELGLSKPDTRAFREIAERLRQQPGDLIMVGDNLFRDSRGALDSGFQHAFHIQRPGSFFNFSQELAAQVMPMTGCTVVHDLRELFWHLPGSKPR